jgi:hypothetical protein
LKNVEIEPLKINQRDLNTKRMMDLMAVAQNDGPVPLYIHTIYPILRNMRMKQQEGGDPFNYLHFKKLVEAAGLSPIQNGPLQQRLDTLESFMPKGQTTSQQPPGQNLSFDNDWTPKVRILERQGSLSVANIYRLVCSLLLIYLALALPLKAHAHCSTFV